MKVVVGVGNPGRRYEQTRHSLGAMVVDRLSVDHGIEVKRRRFDALVGQGQIGSERALLVKPQTYVNLSGRAVAPLLRWHRCPIEDLLVICDDLSLELGRLRLRRKGSSGGHKGLQSIAESLGTDHFPRLRIGIGRGQGADAVSRVLGRFTDEERAAIGPAIAAAADAARLWLEQGIDAAMNQFNQ